MYAVIEVGGKQYKVKPDDIIEVEKQNDKPGSAISLEKVLLVSQDEKLEVGQPYLKQAKVTAEVIADIKAPKVVSYKYKRRKSSHWKKGHRQQLTRIKIKDIELS